MTQSKISTSEEINTLFSFNALASVCVAGCSYDACAPGFNIHPVLCSCSSSYPVLIPQLVCLDDFEQVRSIGRYLEKDWRDLLADCFPKIMVNILPYFALPGQDSQVTQQREKAHRVYDLLKDDNCLGKQVNTGVKLSPGLLGLDFSLVTAASLICPYQEKSCFWRQWKQATMESRHV